MKIAVIGRGNVGGGLDKSRALEDALGLLFAAMQAEGEPVLYRIAKPGEL